MTAIGPTRARAPTGPSVRVLRRWGRVDPWILAVTLGLIAAGLVFVMAASPGAADRADIGDPLYFFRRHAIAAALAVGVVFAAAAMTPVLVRRLGAALWGISAGLLIFVLVVGDAANAARRWVDLGPVWLQPSEFAKPALVIITAWLITSAREAGRGGVGQSLAALAFAVLAGLTLAQPDVGQTALLAATFGVTAFLAGAGARTVLVAVAGLAGGITAGVLVFPHAAARLAQFFSGELGYQAGLARTGLLRGGLWGVGPGEGLVKERLPDAHADFILAVVGEEFGAAALVALLLAFAVLAARTLWRAAQTPDAFSRAAAGGLAAFIGLQAIINAGVALHIAPTKGMTLPFLSYGGSSLLACALSVGWILALTRVDPDVEPARLTATGREGERR